MRRNTPIQGVRGYISHSNKSLVLRRRDVALRIHVQNRRCRFSTRRILDSIRIGLQTEGSLDGSLYSERIAGLPERRTGEVKSITAYAACIGGELGEALHVCC